MLISHDKPQLSVIIPTYNRADLLKLSLQSLARQNIDKELFEVIVIDDGSIDFTSSVCKKFTQKVNLKYFYQRNSGRFVKNYRQNYHQS